MIVHRYSVHGQRGTYKVDMPHGAKVLRAEECQGLIALWTIYDERVLDLITALVKVVASDEQFDIADFRYVGTALFHSGGYVAHVFVSGA